MEAGWRALGTSRWVTYGAVAVLVLVQGCRSGSRSRDVADSDLEDTKLVDISDDSMFDLIEVPEEWTAPGDGLSEAEGSDTPDAEPESLDGCGSRPVLPVYPFGTVFPVFPEPELPEGVVVTVVSLNVYGGKMGTAEDIGTWLAASQADLIGLQECSAALGAEIAAVAGYEHIYGDGTFVLSRTALTDTESIGILGGRGFVRARTVIDEAEFTFYNTHLGWNADGDMQFRRFVDDHLTQDPSMRMVMAGDFNDEHYSTQNTIMEEWGIDCFTAAGIYPGQRISWPSFGFDDTEGSQLIDLIWFPKSFPAIVMEADVVNVPGLLSDHKPVVARLLFPRGDKPYDHDPYAASRDVWRGFPLVPPDNLLINPGGEDGLAGWETEGSGTVTSWRENRVPRTGSGMFAGDEAPDTQGEYWSTGHQTVDVGCYQEEIDGGRAVLWVSGYLTTGYKVEQKGDVVSNMPKPYDDGELVLQMLGGDGQSLGTWMSGRRDTLDWHPAAGVVPVPRGTRTTQLSWVSHHKEANGPSNDALFDDLYLGLGLVDRSHGHVSGNLWPDGGGESGQFVGILDADLVPTEGLPLWHVATDLLPVGPFGLYPYAPWSYSGTRYFVSTPRDLPSNQQNGALGVVCWPLDLLPWSSAAMGEGGAVWLRVSGWLRNYKGLSSGWISLWSLDGEPTEYWRSVAVQAPEWWQVGEEFLLPTGTSQAAVCLHALHASPDDPVFGDGFSVEVVERPIL